MSKTFYVGGYQGKGRWTNFIGIPLSATQIYTSSPVYLEPSMYSTNPEGDCALVRAFPLGASDRILDISIHRSTPTTTNTQLFHMFVLPQNTPAGASSPKYLADDTKNKRTVIVAGIPKYMGLTPTEGVLLWQLYPGYFNYSVFAPDQNLPLNVNDSITDAINSVRLSLDPLVTVEDESVTLYYRELLSQTDMDFCYTIGFSSAATTENTINNIVVLVTKVGQVSTPRPYRELTYLTEVL